MNVLYILLSVYPKYTILFILGSKGVYSIYESTEKAGNKLSKIYHRQAPETVYQGLGKYNQMWYVLVPIATLFILFALINIDHCVS